MTASKDERAGFGGVSYLDSVNMFFSSRALDMGLGLLDVEGQPSRVELFSRLEANCFEFTSEMAVLCDFLDAQGDESLGAIWWRFMRLWVCTGKFVSPELTSLRAFEATTAPYKALRSRFFETGFRLSGLVKNAADTCIYDWSNDDARRSLHFDYRGAVDPGEVEERLREAASDEIAEGLVLSITVTQKDARPVHRTESVFHSAFEPLREWLDQYSAEQAAMLPPDDSHPPKRPRSERLAGRHRLTRLARGRF